MSSTRNDAKSELLTPLISKPTHHDEEKEEKRTQPILSLAPNDDSYQLLVDDSKDEKSENKHTDNNVQQNTVIDINDQQKQTDIFLKL